MSYYTYKQQLEAMSERDRKIWELHQRSVNAMGFAAQAAGQGNENSQCRYEDKSAAADQALWELLIQPEPQAKGGVEV